MSLSSSFFDSFINEVDSMKHFAKMFFYSEYFDACEIHGNKHIFQFVSIYEQLSKDEHLVKYFVPKLNGYGRLRLKCKTPIVYRNESVDEISVILTVRPMLIETALMSSNNSDNNFAHIDCLGYSDDVKIFDEYDELKKHLYFVTRYIDHTIKQKYDTMVKNTSDALVKNTSDALVKPTYVDELKRNSNTEIEQAFQIPKKFGKTKFNNIQFKMNVVNRFQALYTSDDEDC